MSRLGSVAWAWLPVLAWMALILTLSSQSNVPARENPVTGEVIRSTYTLAKLAHVVEYAVLALLLLRATTSPLGGIRLGFVVAALWSIVAATLFGAADELRQSFVPNREPSFGDVLIDGASALAAVCVASVARRLRAGLGILRRTTRPVRSSPPVGE